MTIVFMLSVKEWAFKLPAGIPEKKSCPGLTSYADRLFSFQVHERLDETTLIVTQLPAVGNRYIVFRHIILFAFAGSRFTLRRGQQLFMAECICPHGLTP